MMQFCSGRCGFIDRQVSPRTQRYIEIRLIAVAAPK
jgi:hypothetical protein